MGASKMEFYTEHQIQMANMFKALGHPARIAIVEELVVNNNFNCTDLYTIIPLAPSTISYHLKELFENWILGYYVKGSNCYYRPNKESFKVIFEYLSAIHIQINRPDYAMKNGYVKPRIIHKSTFFFRV